MGELLGPRESRTGKPPKSFNESSLPLKNVTLKKLTAKQPENPLPKMKFKTSSTKLNLHDVEWFSEVSFFHGCKNIMWPIIGSIYAIIESIYAIIGSIYGIYLTLHLLQNSTKTRWIEYILPETNMTNAPENRPKLPQKETRKSVFQPSIFRWENVSFREGTIHGSYG